MSARITGAELAAYGRNVKSYPWRDIWRLVAEVLRLRALIADIDDGAGISKWNALRAEADTIRSENRVSRGKDTPGPSEQTRTSQG